MCPRRQVSGLTPPGQGALRRGRGRARRVAAGRADRRGRRDADARTRGSSSPRSKACRTPRSSGPSCRFRRTRSIRIAASLRISTSRRRAPARCTRCTTGTARLVVASAAALLPRVSRAASASTRPRMTLTPGQDISPTDLGDLLAAAGYTRQDPVDETGEFCVRGGVVDFYPAGAERADPARVRRRHDRVDPRLRPRDAAIDRRRSIRPRSRRCRSCSAIRTTPIARRRSSTTCGRRHGRWCSSRSRTRSRRTARS